MRMRQRARFVAVITLAFLIGVLLAALACTSVRVSKPYYITLPIRGQDSISVFYDMRELTWLNAGLLAYRGDLQESGVCLHIRATSGDSVFYVDSLEMPAFLPYRGLPDWRHVQFMCPPETAPLHWHVIVASLRPWLQSQMGDSSEFVFRHRCEFSPGDTSSFWARYPFVAMQCGVGPDSIHVFKVRKHR